MTPTSTDNLNDALTRGAVDPELSSVIALVAKAAARLAVVLSEVIPPISTDTAVINAGGDVQHPLDHLANELFIAELAEGRVRAVLSEEADGVVMLDSAAGYAVALDPLDGSANIPLNAPLGTIFTVLRASAIGIGPNDAFSVGADAIAAAGYVIYGAATLLVLSTGSGVDVFQLDLDKATFVQTATSIAVPSPAVDFAINCSNRRHWDASIRAYIDDLTAGSDGPRERDFNMRWLAAVVAEAHRIMVRGGIYLYPGDRRRGYNDGRLRLVYEAHPLAYLMEQAGGAATDGETRILDKVATSLHERTSLIFGSGDEVARVGDYSSTSEHIGERSPLFARRGLLRS